MPDHGPDPGQINLSSGFNDVCRAKLLDAVVNSDNQFFSAIVRVKKEQESGLIRVCRIKHDRPWLIKQRRQALIPIKAQSSLF